MYCTSRSLTLQRKSMYKVKRNNFQQNKVVGGWPHCNIPGHGERHSEIET